MIGRYVSQRSQCGFVSSCSAAADSVPRVDPAFERLLTARFGPFGTVYALFLGLVLTVITDFREIFIGTERQNQAERLGRSVPICILSEPLGPALTRPT